MSVPYFHAVARLARLAQLAFCPHGHSAAHPWKRVCCVIVTAFLADCPPHACRKSLCFKACNVALLLLTSAKCGQLCMCVVYWRIVVTNPGKACFPTPSEGVRAEDGIPLASREQGCHHRAILAEEHPVFLIGVDERPLAILEYMLLIHLHAFAEDQPLHRVEVAANRLCSFVTDAHSTPLRPVCVDDIELTRVCVVVTLRARRECVETCIESSSQR